MRCMSPIEFIRTQKFDISQAALAKISGVNQATVSRWESGGLEPGRAEMAAIRDEARKRGITWDDRWFFEVEARATDDAA